MTAPQTARGFVDARGTATNRTASLGRNDYGFITNEDGGRLPCSIRSGRVLIKGKEIRSGFKRRWSPLRLIYGSAFYSFIYSGFGAMASLAANDFDFP